MFFYKGEEDCLDDFMDKTNKILGDFPYFVRQKQITWADEEKKLYSNETVCYLCDKEFERNLRELVKVRNSSYYTEYNGIYVVNSYISVVRSDRHKWTWKKHWGFL